MKKLSVAALAFIAAFALPVSSAMATESSANAALTSDYVFRGKTQSDGGVAIQGGYDIQQSKQDIGWYAGVFGSTVKKGLEVDLYGGWKGAFSTNKSLGYDVGGIFYKYTDGANSDLDATELYAGINYETAYLKIFFGNSSGGGSHNYIDLGASFVVMKDIDLNVHYGRFSSSAVDYNDVSASVSTSMKGIDIGLGLTYTDDNTEQNNTKFIVTASKKFDL